MGASGPEAPTPAERRKIVGRFFGRSKEGPAIRELPVAPEVPPEIEKGQPVPGADATLKKPIIDDKTGQVLVAPAGTEELVVKLPLRPDQLTPGLKGKISNSFLWLKTWCLRILKIKNES